MKPELNILAARSFWWAILTVVANFMVLLGYSPIDVEARTDEVMQVVSGIGMLAVYLERVTGRAKLVPPWR